MKQLTPNVFVELGLRGSNHGIVTTSDGIVLIDGPHKPSDAVRLRDDGSVPDGRRAGRDGADGDAPERRQPVRLRGGTGHTYARRTLRKGDIPHAMDTLGRVD